MPAERTRLLHVRVGLTRNARNAHLLVVQTTLSQSPVPLHQTANAELAPNVDVSSSLLQSVQPQKTRSANLAHVVQRALSVLLRALPLRTQFAKLALSANPVLSC